MGACPSCNMGQDTTSDIERWFPPNSLEDSRISDKLTISNTTHQNTIPGFGTCRESGTTTPPHGAPNVSQLCFNSSLNQQQSSGSAILTTDAHPARSTTPLTNLGVEIKPPSECPPAVSTRSTSPNSLVPAPASGVVGNTEGEGLGSRIASYAKSALNRSFVLQPSASKQTSIHGNRIPGLAPGYTRYRTDTDLRARANQAMDAGTGREGLVGMDDGEYGIDGLGGIGGGDRDEELSFARRLRRRREIRNQLRLEMGMDSDDVSNDGEGDEDEDEDYLTATMDGMGELDQDDVDGDELTDSEAYDTTESSEGESVFDFIERRKAERRARRNARWGVPDPSYGLDKETASRGKASTAAGSISNKRRVGQRPQHLQPSYNQNNQHNRSRSGRTWSSISVGGVRYSASVDGGPVPRVLLVPVGPTNQHQHHHQHQQQQPHHQYHGHKPAQSVAEGILDGTHRRYNNSNPTNSNLLNNHNYIHSSSSNPVTNIINNNNNNHDRTNTQPHQHSTVSPLHRPAIPSTNSTTNNPNTHNVSSTRRVSSFSLSPPNHSWGQAQPHRPHPLSHSHPQRLHPPYPSSTNHPDSSILPEPEHSKVTPSHDPIRNTTKNSTSNDYITTKRAGDGNENTRGIDIGRSASAGTTEGQPTKDNTPAVLHDNNNTLTLSINPKGGMEEKRDQERDKAKVNGLTQDGKEGEMKGGKKIKGSGSRSQRTGAQSMKAKMGPSVVQEEVVVHDCVAVDDDHRATLKTLFGGTEHGSGGKGRAMGKQGRQSRPGEDQGDRKDGVDGEDESEDSVVESMRQRILVDGRGDLQGKSKGRSGLDGRGALGVSDLTKWKGSTDSSSDADDDDVPDQILTGPKIGSVPVSLPISKANNIPRATSINKAEHDGDPNHDTNKINSNNNIDSSNLGETRLPMGRNGGVGHSPYLSSHHFSSSTQGTSGLTLTGGKGNIQHPSSSRHPPVGVIEAGRDAPKRRHRQVGHGPVRKFIGAKGGVGGEGGLGSGRIGLALYNPMAPTKKYDLGEESPDYISEEERLENERIRKINEKIKQEEEAKRAAETVEERKAREEKERIMREADDFFASIRTDSSSEDGEEEEEEQQQQQGGEEEEETVKGEEREKGRNVGEEGVNEKPAGPKTTSLEDESERENGRGREEETSGDKTKGQVGLPPARQESPTSADGPISLSTSLAQDATDDAIKA